MDKKSKKKYSYILLGIIVLFIFSGVNEQQKKEASVEVCESWNTGGFIITDSAYTACQSSGCAVQYNIDPTIYDIIPGISFIQWFANVISEFRSDFATCSNEVDVGKWLRASSDSNANQLCVEKKAIKVENNWFSEDIYRCIDNPGGICSSSWMTLPSQLYDSIFGSFLPIDDCTSKSIVLISLAGFLVLIAL